MKRSDTMHDVASVFGQLLGHYDWKGVSVYLSPNMSEPAVVARSGAKEFRIPLDFDKAARHLTIGDKRRFVELIDDALEAIHRKLFPPRPPKGWVLFGRRPRVVFA